MPNRAGNIRSLALLRGLAVLAVMWDHVVGEWTTNHGRSWIPLRTVQDWVSNPLAIIQNFGFLGVCIFFLVSGYIISEVAVRETRTAFVVKRVLRIYPGLIVSILVILGILALRPHIGLGTVEGNVGVGQTIWALTLVNYVRATQAPVNGVAWSLAIEVLFYVLVFATVGLLRRRPVIAILVELALIALVIDTARGFPVTRFIPNWFLLAANLSYLPLLVIGQAVWLWSTKRCSALVAATLGALAWFTFVFGMRRLLTPFLAADNSYGVSVALALTIFIVTLRNEEHIRVPRSIAAVSVVSYSVYLIHGPVTGVVMDGLSPDLPFTISLAIALAALAVVAVLMWRCVELPSQALARRLLLRRSKRAVEPAAESRS